MAVGFYDLVHAFDHHLKKSWIFSSGLPCQKTTQRKERAERRMNFYLSKILYNPIAKRAQFSHTQGNPRSNFKKLEYLQAVNKAIEYIKAGDIFEVNLSQRFELDLLEDYEPFSLFLKIKKINPSPFSAYLNLGYTKIISSSPERFIEVNNNGHVETRPIKGTRKRSLNPSEDERLAKELIVSEKDRAENIMIVDLMRNDLSHVCEEDSIIVPQLCGHEIYPRVHHLVSVVKGILKSQYNGFDLLRFSFPGGSITGAPKIRAMQIISELEPHQRGPYCGSIFLASFDGMTMDSSIIIRTYVIQGNLISFHGGGAVTIDSDAEEEYEETLAKVNVLKEALGHIDV
jgi:para-aminobenzoate synthetase component 1